MDTTTNTIPDEDGAFRGRDPGRDEPSKRDLAILSACCEPLMPQQIVQRTGIPKSSVHRRIRWLEKHGYLIRVGVSFVVSETGKSILAKLPAPASPLAALERMWAFLKMMPSNLHAALCSLILLARIARRDQLSPDHNPAFLLLGPSQKLKSWTLRLLCRLLGVPPEQAIILMPQVRPRSLITRLDAKGEPTHVNPALSGPFVGLEESSQANRSVWQDAVTLVQGDLKIRVDQNTIDLRAVVIMEMNYKDAKSRDIEKKSGFDVPRLRRFITADLGSLQFSSVAVAAAHDFLAGLSKDDEPDLPIAPKEALPQDGQRYIEQTLRTCVREEFADHICRGRLITLTRAARALFPLALDAAKLVIRLAFTLFETTGYVADGWKERLDHLDTPGSCRVETPAMEMTTNAMSTIARNQVFEKELTLIESHKMAALIRVLRRLQERGVDESEVFMLLDDTARLLELNHVMLRLGVNAAAIDALMAIKYHTRPLGLAVEEIVGAVVELQDLHRIGFTLQTARAVAWHLRNNDPTGDNANEALNLQTELAHQGVSLRDFVDGLNQEIEWASQQKQRLHQENEYLEAQKETLRSERCQLDQEVVDKSTELDDLSVQLQQVEKKLSKTDQILEDARHEYEELRAKSLTTLTIHNLFFNPAYGLNGEEQVLVWQFLDAARQGFDREKVQQLATRLTDIGLKMAEHLPTPSNQHDRLQKTLKEMADELTNKGRQIEDARKTLDTLASCHVLLQALNVILNPQPGQELLRTQLLPEMKKAVDLLCSTYPTADWQSKFTEACLKLHTLLYGGLQNPGAQGNA